MSQRQQCAVLAAYVALLITTAVLLVATAPR